MFDFNYSVKYSEKLPQWVNLYIFLSIYYFEIIILLLYTKLSGKKIAIFVNFMGN